MKFEFNFLRKEMINENDNKGTTYGSRIAANNTKQRLRRIACRTAHEWLDKSDEVFEQFHEKHRCDVSVVLYPPKDYVYDPPNYSPTSKAIIDGLTDAGIWSDDNKNIIRRTSFEHGGLSGDTKKWKIELVVKVMQVGALIAIVLSKLPISRRLWNERKKRRRKTFF